MSEFYPEEHTEVLARVVWAQRRPSRWWLVGAALSLAVAVLLTAIAPATTHGSDAMLERDAEDIARALDTVAHAAHLRADSIAKTPMMRAAILTDAETVADMMRSEFNLQLAPGDVVELFQSRDGKLEPLSRWPATAAALSRPKDRTATIVVLDRNGLRVVVGAHVDRLRDGEGYDAHIAGMFVLSVPVDLAPIQRRLTEHAAEATLTQARTSIHLFPPRSRSADCDVVSLAVPSETAMLTLTVAASEPGATSWIDVVRYLSFGLTALLLIAFALILVLRRPKPQRA